MRAQHFGALLFCAQISHHTIPERTCSTQFRYLHEEIHADSEEERKTTGELAYIKSRSHSAAHIFGTIRNGEGEFLHLCRTGFLHMIARAGDAVELRSEEHTSELQSLMRISYPVSCLKHKQTPQYSLLNKLLY